MEPVKQPPAKVLQRRKFLLVLPILVIPFLTMAFWALGGGKGSNESVQVLRRTEGFNMDLPTAKVDSDSSWDKMKFYEQADAEAARREMQIRNDPYYKLPLTETEPEDTFNVTMPVNTKGVRSMDDRPAAKSPYASTEYKDQNETKVYQKLAELDQQLKAKSTIPPVPGTNNVSGNSSYNRYESDHLMGHLNSGEESPEMRRLQQMMESMSQTSSEPDPELLEINKVLDKLMDVQHPDRVKEKLKTESENNKTKVFPVSISGNETPVSVLENQGVRKPDSTDSSPTTFPASSGFYSLEANASAEIESNTITAVIHENQTLVGGATIKLRLTSDILIQGVSIPKDQFVFGTAALNGERLNITINSVRYKNGLYPVDLSVYDLDGMVGINIPGAMTRDVAKQSADQSLQSMGLTSIDPSISMQAASAGIDVTKNLLSKRVRLIKVAVKAGYQVLLKDNNNK